MCYFVLKDIFSVGLIYYTCHICVIYLKGPMKILWCWNLGDRVPASTWIVFGWNLGVKTKQIAQVIIA
jgi:hypothetical protein